MKLKTICGILGTGVLVGAGSTLVVSQYVDWARPCVTVVARVGTSPLVTDCRPLQVTDPPIVVSVALAAALFAPALQEVELFGILTLRRRLDESEGRQSQLEQHVADLRLIVGSSASSASAASVVVHNYPQDPEHLAEQVQEQLQRLTEVPDYPSVD